MTRRYYLSLLVFLVLSTFACNQSTFCPTVPPHHWSPVHTPIPFHPTSTPTATPTLIPTASPTPQCVIPESITLPGEFDLFCLMMNPTPQAPLETLVIRSQADWEAYWSSINAFRVCKNQTLIPLPPAPVDFSQKMILIRFVSGQECWVGYEIQQVCFMDQKILVKALRQIGCSVLVRCNGYAYSPRSYVVDRSNLPVEWEYTDVHVPMPGCP
jgi:hypothetical protein